MREGLREARLVIDLQQQIRDAHGGQTVIEIEHQVLGGFRYGRGQPVDFQDTILDRASRDRACAGGLGQALKPPGQPGLAIRDPGLWLKGHRQSRRRLGRLHRHQGLLQIAIAP